MACLYYTGGDPRRDPRATSPLGPFGTVQFPSGTSYSGELLAADDSSYVLLSSNHVLVFRYEPGMVANFANTGGIIRGRPKERELQRLRLESRHPYGIPDAAMRALLEKGGQQAPDTARPDAFNDQARKATERYRDPSVAIADGYKKVGVEFPAMGEHWVNLARVLENRFSPNAPPVLIYVNVDGERRLAGVGYTALLGPGERPPATPAPESAWHEHNGSVIDESFALHHANPAHAAHASSDSAELRLAILHAWVWATNPAGRFVTDNWSLPQLRLGATAPLDSVMLRAASLALDEEGYYAMVVRTGLGVDPASAEAETVRRIVDAKRQSAWTALDRRPNDTLDAATEAKLVAIWESLWSDLARALPSQSARLREIRSRL